MVDATTHALGHVGVAISFGLVIMVMIYAVGHISGAHFNPAVTFAFALTRHFPWRRVALYWPAQLAGALAAALVLRGSLGERRARRRDAAQRLRRTGVPVGERAHVLPDVRDHGGGHRHPRGGRGGRDRDRRHGRAGRDVRRPDHRRVDEPGPLARAGHRRRRLHGDLGVHRRAAARGCRGRRRLPVPARRARPRTWPSRARRRGRRREPRAVRLHPERRAAPRSRRRCSSGPRQAGTRRARPAAGPPRTSTPRSSR